jgi:putative ABC transport system permease protein
LRAHLGSQRAISLVTVLSTATSVALATGLETSARSVERELVRTADELAGAAQLEVTGGGLGIPEDILGRVSSVRGVRVAAPLVQASFRVGSEPGSSASLHVLGVDLLADPGVRTYGAMEKTRVFDPLRLIAGSDSILISEALSQRLGVGDGDTLNLIRGAALHRVAVRGVLEGEGVGEAFGGQVAVMDVYTLQTLLGREGWLDRIDVVVEDGLDVESVLAQVQTAVGGVASVRRSAVRDFWVENTLETLRLVVSAMVMIAILVASLLAHGAMSLFADRRSSELVLLQLSGLEPRRVRRLLYGDALLLSLVGSILGVGLGAVLSRYFLDVLSWVSDFLQDVEIRSLEVRGSTMLLALGVGVGVAVVGVLEPAHRAGSTSPLDVVRETRFARAGARGHRLGRVLALALVGVAAWVAFDPPGLSPIAQVGLIAAAGIGALTLASRDPIPRWIASLRPAIERFVPGLGRLVGASLVARPAQTAIAIACVGSVLTAMTIAASLVRSVSRTVDEWTESQYPGGILVTAGSAFSIRAEELVAPETVELIRITEGVRSVFDHFTATILFRGEEVLIGAGSMEAMATHGRLPVIDADPRVVARRVAAGGAVVSDGFSRRFQVSTGDWLELDTPKGRRAFQVAGIMRDYAGPSGSVNIDIGVFDELWDRAGSRDLVLWVEGPPETVIERIRERVAERQLLFFVYGEELSRFASRLLERVERLLDMTALMMAVLGGIAVASLLVGAVAARVRELALLLASGATRRQISLLIVLDGLLVGGIGGIGGVVVGLATAVPVVTRVIPEAMGWSLSLSIDARALSVIGATVLLASAAASVYPARLAANVPLREAVSPE